MSTFSIGDILVIGANGEGTPGWSYNNIKGWYDFEQDQNDSDPRPGQDGSFSADETYSSQATPSIEGVFTSSSAFEVAQAKMLLRTIKNQGQRLPVVWDDHGMVTQRRVSVIRAVPTHSAGRPGFKWAVDMFAADPALYGVSLFTGPIGPISRGDGGLRFDSYAGTNYSWSGATNASPSVQTVDGVETRRNDIVDPLFTNSNAWYKNPNATYDFTQPGGVSMVVNATTAAGTFVTYPSAGMAPGEFGSPKAASYKITNTGTSSFTVYANTRAYGAASSTDGPSSPDYIIAPGATVLIRVPAVTPTADNLLGYRALIRIKGTMTAGQSLIVSEHIGETVATTSDVAGEFFSGASVGTGLGPGLVFPETYGTLGSDGRLRIYNPGSAPAYSIFTFVGGSSLGFSITKVSTGESISVEREIPIGAVVVVNPRTGRVTIDGAENDISGSLRDDDWFTTASGMTDQVQLGILGTPYGSPTLSAETQPAY
jgi:hypothetical protein